MHAAASRPHTACIREFHGSATRFVDATPEAVFDLITDIDRLPDWNSAIESVVTTPAELAEILRVGRGHETGRVAEVEQSFSHPRRINRRRTPVRVPVPERRRQASYIDWMWSVTAVDGGAQVTVAGTHIRRRSRGACSGAVRTAAAAQQGSPASLDAIDQQSHEGATSNAQGSTTDRDHPHRVPRRGGVDQHLDGYTVDIVSHDAEDSDLAPILKGLPTISVSAPTGAIFKGR